MLSCILYLGPHILHTRYISCNILPIECNQLHFLSYLYFVNGCLSFKTRFCEYYWERTSLWLNFWLSDPAALPCPPRGFPHQCKLYYTAVHCSVLEFAPVQHSTLHCIKPCHVLHTLRIMLPCLPHLFPQSCNLDLHCTVMGCSARNCTMLCFQTQRTTVQMQTWQVWASG